MDVAVVVLDGYRQVWWRLVFVVSLRAGKKIPPFLDLPPGTIQTATLHKRLQMNDVMV